MIDETKVKGNIAQNIAAYRKAENITQLELAEMLNYSDKAVSKWERGDSVPDIVVLCQIANIFRISVNDLLSTPAPERIKPAVIKLKRRLIIPLLATGLVWLVAVIIYVFLGMLSPYSEKYLCFIYAIPASFVVLVVFSVLWWRPLLQTLCVSALIWTTTLCVHLSISTFTQIENAFLFYIIAVPLQIMVLLWFAMKSRPGFNRFVKRFFKIQARRGQGADETKSETANVSPLQPTSGFRQDEAAEPPSADKS